MQNFSNSNYFPPIDNYIKYADPATNDPFNKATQPGDKPIISKHIFAVDSRQRDYNKYPNANNYYVPVPDRYRNVTGVELKAAMLPRTEYNINSTNNIIDISIGDYISQIKTINNSDVSYVVKENNHERNIPIPPGTYHVEITNALNQNGSGAIITANINNLGRVENFNITNSGTGYKFSNPPLAQITNQNNNVSSLPTTTVFNINLQVIIGIQYEAQLREGQYTIGGNPTYYGGGTNVAQSWTPENLINEIENALSFSIFNSNLDSGIKTDAARYCYRRIPWIQTTSSSGSSATDYPLLISTRIMSQYPTLDTYVDPTTVNRKNNFNYETNACKYNRMYFSNNLIFKANNTSSTPVVSNSFTDAGGVIYNILAYNKIPGTSSDYILFCQLNDPSLSWPGLTPGTVVGSLTFTAELAHWEMLFATGENQVINSASLLGFNKTNYSIPTEIESVKVEVVDSVGALAPKILIPSSLTYSTNNDYYLQGDPEYINLSFRAKYGTSSVSGINDRVDSNPNSNIDRIFACLIYDAVQPAVLTDLSSGQIQTFNNSVAETTNLLKTGITQDKNLDEVQQLTANCGTQNTTFHKTPGMLKALKGSDFDKKLIEFTQPIAEMFSLNIRFTKFSKKPIGSPEELYDFHGKEHLLLFEITCGDLLTGRRD